MAPPEYSDVGKAARDLLSKEYNFGKSKFEAKSTTQSGVEFTSLLERKHSDGTLRAELKSKLKHSESGLVFTDTYSSDNDLSIKIEAPSVAEGLKLELDSTFSPNSGAKDFKAGSVFKTDSFITTFALSRKLKADANREGFIVKADAVVGHEGFVAGAQASFDASSSAFTDYSAVVGYSEKSYAITLHAEKRFSQFVTTYNHIINKEVTVAAQATFASANKNVAIEFGAQYKLDDNTTLKAKADSSGNAGLGFIHKIRPDLKGTFGLLVDTRNLDQPAHRCGYSLTFEPK